MISKISQFENVFKGETLTVVNDSFFDREKLREPDFILATDLAFNLCDATFWGSSRFSTLFYKYMDEITKDPEIRILAPDKIKVDCNLIYYIPKPIWAFGHSYIERWKKKEKGEDCPVGWGSLGLSIGFAYRLGFDRVTAFGFSLTGKEWNPIQKTYLPCRQSRSEYQRGMANAKKLASLLGISLDIRN